MKRHEESHRYEYRDTRMTAYTDRQGQPASLPPTGGDVLARDQWNAAWKALSAEAKATYMALPSARKGELDKMTAAQLTDAMKQHADVVELARLAKDGGGYLGIDHWTEADRARADDLKDAAKLL